MTINPNKRCVLFVCSTACMCTSFKTPGQWKADFLPSLLSGTDTTLWVQNFPPGITCCSIYSNNPAWIEWCITKEILLIKLQDWLDFTHQGSAGVGFMDLWGNSSFKLLSQHPPTPHPFPPLSLSFVLSLSHTRLLETVFPPSTIQSKLLCKKSGFSCLH